MKQSTFTIIVIALGIFVVAVANIGIDREIAFEDTKLEQSLSEANRVAIVSSW